MGKTPTVWPGPPFFLAFVVLHPPEGDPSGFGWENLEVEADAVAIFVLPSCADLEPEVVLPVLAFDDVKQGVVGFAIGLSFRLPGRPMAQLGITPQKPLYRAIERDATLVQRWLKTEYPKIRTMAKAQGADIYFGDAAHIRSDHHAGRTWGKKGETRWSRPPVHGML